MLRCPSLSGVVRLSSRRALLDPACGHVLCELCTRGALCNLAFAGVRRGLRRFPPAHYIGVVAPPVPGPCEVGTCTYQLVPPLQSKPGAGHRSHRHSAAGQGGGARFETSAVEGRVHTKASRTRGLCAPFALTGCRFRNCVSHRGFANGWIAEFSFTRRKRSNREPFESFGVGGLVGAVLQGNQAGLSSSEGSTSGSKVSKEKLVSGATINPCN